MKKLLTILGILLLVGAFAIPVLAHGPGWGRGHHMMGDWGSGPEYGSQDWRGSSTLSEEERTKLDQLNRDLYEETARLRNEILAMSTELDALLSEPNPDLEGVKALHREISDLRAKLAEKRINYELEARKVNPDAPSGRGYGRGYGRHMRGYGTGGCWD